MPEIDKDDCRRTAEQPTNYPNLRRSQRGRKLRIQSEENDQREAKNSSVLFTQGQKSYKLSTPPLPSSAKHALSSYIIIFSNTSSSSRRDKELHKYKDEVQQRATNITKLSSQGSQKPPSLSAQSRLGTSSSAESGASSETVHSSWASRSREFNATTVISETEGITIATEDYYDFSAFLRSGRLFGVGGSKFD